MLYAVYGTGEAPLKIESVGYTSDPKKARFGPARRDQYIIHYVLDGKGYFNGAPVVKGQGFLITPHSFERYYPDKNDAWRFIWFIFTDVKMEEFFARYDADPKTKIFTFHDFLEAENVVLKIKSNHNRICDRLLLLEWFLSVFNANAPALREKNDSHKNEYIRFATEYIENNIYEPISVSTLTQLLGISQPYLYTIFKDTFSVSPKTYLTERKLYHAKKLLVETNLSVSEIARSVGFEDALAFSKFFSKNENINPTRFREKHKDTQKI